MKVIAFQSMRRSGARPRSPTVLNASQALRHAPSRWLEGTTESITRPQSGAAEKQFLISRLENGRWTYPQRAVFQGIPLEDVPAYHPDGTALFDLARTRPYPDGRFLFFKRDHQLYWIDAGVIEDLRKQEGRSRDIFNPQGRVLAEGRIFSVACRDLDGDNRPDIAVSDFLNPARILYNDAGLL